MEIKKNQSHFMQLSNIGINAGGFSPSSTSSDVDDLITNPSSRLPSFSSTIEFGDVCDDGDTFFQSTSRASPVTNPTQILESDDSDVSSINPSIRNVTNESSAVRKAQRILDQQNAVFNALLADSAADRANTEELQRRIQERLANRVDASHNQRESEQTQGPSFSEFLGGYLDTAVSFVSHVFLWIINTICCCWGGGVEESEETRVSNFLANQEMTAEQYFSRYLALPEAAKQFARQEICVQGLASAENGDYYSSQWISRMESLIRENPRAAAPHVRAALEHWLNEQRKYTRNHL